MTLPSTNRSRNEQVANISRAAIRLHRAFMHELDARLQATERLTAHQFSLLHFLRSNPNVTQAQIAHEFHIGAQTVVKLIDYLAQEGWVARQVDETDRRVRRIALSAPRERLELVFSVFAALQEEFLSELTEGELNTYERIQKKMESKLIKDQ